MCVRPQLELLPELIAKRVVQQQQQQQSRSGPLSLNNDSLPSNTINLLETRRNFLHPEYAVSPLRGGSLSIPSSASPFLPSTAPLLASTSSMLPTYCGPASSGPSSFTITSAHNQPVTLTHSKSVPPTFLNTHHHNWPNPVPVLPPVSSRTPHLIPEPILPNS